MADRPLSLPALPALLIMPTSLAIRRLASPTSIRVQPRATSFVSRLRHSTTASVIIRRLTGDSHQRVRSRVSPTVSALDHGVVRTESHAVLNDQSVLVGDAAHAASPAAGQGASMALEDSAILAKCLRDLPDTQQAFTTYERHRRQRVERLVAISAAQGTRSTRAESREWLYRHHIAGQRQPRNRTRQSGDPIKHSCGRSETATSTPRLLDRAERNAKDRAVILAGDQELAARNSRDAVRHAPPPPGLRSRVSD